MLAPEAAVKTLARAFGGARADGPTGHGTLPSVWADDREAMLTLVEYLAAIGHRRIAHVAGASAHQAPHVLAEVEEPGSVRDLKTPRRG